MDTENNHENEPTDKPKFTDKLSSLITKTKSDNETEEETPVKKVKRQATQEELNHPLHGVKLAYILESVVNHYGWPYLADRVKIQCFIHNPSVKVSLLFLRKMDWARKHVEEIYMEMLEEGFVPKKPMK